MLRWKRPHWGLTGRLGLIATAVLATIYFLVGEGRAKSNEWAGIVSAIAAAVSMLVA